MEASYNYDERNPCQGDTAFVNLIKLLRLRVLKNPLNLKVKFSI